MWALFPETIDLAMTWTTYLTQTLHSNVPWIWLKTCNELPNQTSTTCIAFHDIVVFGRTPGGTSLGQATLPETIEMGVGVFGHPEIRPWRFGLVINTKRNQTTSCPNAIILR